MPFEFRFFYVIENIYILSFSKSVFIFCNLVLIAIFGVMWKYESVKLSFEY